MTDTSRAIDAIDTAADGGSGSPQPPTVPPRLWESDAGSLRAPSRRALVRLIQGPSLTADRHPQLWDALLNDEAEIRARLADIFLDLVVDTSAQVAFIRNVEEDDLEAPKVVRTVPLTFIDTALLLHLRQLLLRSAGAERTIVGQDEVTDQLSVYRAHDNADPAGFIKRINASWSKFIKAGVLATTSTEGRFEVSPVLRLIFGPEQIAAVRDEYAALAANAGLGNTSADTAAAATTTADTDAAGTRVGRTETDVVPEETGVSFIPDPMES